jgi:NADH-quinone oxidoreductase subunit L
VTYPVFLVGALAISGVPFLSGFFSKDAILAGVFAGGHYVLYGLGLAGAIMTAFYMFRLVYLTFHGERRAGQVGGFHPVHEAPPVMTVPLVILAAFSALAGFVGLPVFLGDRANLFGRFLERALAFPAHHPGPATEAALILAATGAALAGIALAFLFYRKRPGLPERTARRFYRVYRLLVGKYHVDEAYDAVIVRPLVRGSEAIYKHFDLKVVDGTLNGSAAAANLAGKGLSFLQSGLLKDYALAFLIGVMVFLGVILL